MQFVKGMRDKLEKHIDVNKTFIVEMTVLGKATYDCCCFGVDKDGKLSNENYMIFYNQTSTPNNDINYKKSGNIDIFEINLSNIPKEIVKLVFTVSIDGKGTMSEIDKFTFTIKQSGKEDIVILNTGKDFRKEAAIISAEIYIKDAWRLAAISNGFNGGLSALLNYFGGIEEKNINEQIIDNSNILKEQSIQKIPAKKVEKVLHAKETFNPQNNNSNLTKVSFKYNPYIVESTIAIDGNLVQPPNKFYDWKNERIQVWIDQLMPTLIDLCNDKYFYIEFYGLALDYDDLYETVKEYCSNHKDIEVSLEFTESKGSEDRLVELEKLFEEMQRDCPFEDLKTKQVQDNFYNAISSEFEVSVIATMSSGKSTLINSLLGRELMPSKNEACTATIAKIKDKNDADVFTAEYRDRENNILGNYPNLSLANMDEMNANPATAYIDIEGNIPNIDSSGIKLVLVDTPGPNNSRTEEHKNHTYRVIKEKTKPMVLYVLNATQLQTNDDYTLLGTVAEAMKVGGKQSKDRFIFAVNKIDQFDPDKESVQDALEHVREYLQKFDIENPNIFPTSAETAKVIRMYKNGLELTKGQKKTLDNCNIFIEEKQLHLSEQASLSKNNLLKVNSAIEKAKQNADIYEEIMWYTGIPAVEIAINEYLQRYAYTAKIKTAVDTFKKKVEEKDMHAKMISSIQNNESLRSEVHNQLTVIKGIINDGREAQKFRNRIETLDMMKDAKIRIRKVRAKISTELNPSTNKGAMTTLEVRQLITDVNNKVSHLQSDVKTELESIINDVIVENAQSIMKEYTVHIHDLIQNGVVNNQEYDVSGNKVGVGFLEMTIPNAQEIIDNYKYDEKYDTGETEWVKNTSKRWYNPFTWLQKSGYFRPKYDNREMVDYSTVENEFLTPIISSFNENLESAQNTAVEEAKKFKQFFLRQLDDLEKALKKKVEENEKLTQNKSSIEATIQAEKEKVTWLENFLSRLDAVLEI